MEKKGLLAVVSGFAGSGKGSAMKGLVAKYPEEYMLSVSETTRSPRPGEVQGREYFFVSDEEFEAHVREDALIEHAGYVGHYYGTPRRPVEEAIHAGQSVLLEIEIQGALQIKEKFPEAVLLFLSPPSAEILRQRLVGRGTEDEATVQKRLSRAAEEAKGIGSYDYLVINDDLSVCIEEIHQILTAERCKVSRNQETVERLQREVGEFA